MSRVLGLDIGTNSIGWALIDRDKNKIVDTGVRIFEEGLNRKGAAEESKNASRRVARQTRRMNARRKSRRDKLLYIMGELGMYPESEHEIAVYRQLDPYELRARGLDEKLTLQEFGRVLLHINKRRGFRSNRKTDKESEKGVLYSGKDGKTGIDETSEAIATGGYRTLGEYLNSLDSHQHRQRNRYTLRSMYIDEFNQLYGRQVMYYPEILGDVKDDIYHTIFNQRPLKSQKHLVRHCPFEPKKKVASKSSPVFQYFRILEQCVRIRIDDEGRHNSRLTSDEFESLVQELLHKEKLTFKQVIKLLSFNPDARINLQSQDNLKGHTTNFQLAKVFGKKTWYAIPDKDQYDIWNVFHFYSDPVDDPEWLERHARAKWSISEENIPLLLKVKLEPEYCNLSQKAMNKIIPYLELQYSYDTAVLLAGVQNAMGCKTVLDEEIADEVLTIYHSKEDSLPLIKKHLSEKYGIAEEDLKRLYHHSKLRKDAGNRQYLPLPDDLRNPIVMKALFEVRKMINAIIHEYGKPDEIRVELARDTKNPKWKRIGIMKLNRQREQKAKEIKERLIAERIVTKPTRDDVIKYLLWEECNQTCPYTGQHISLSVLYSNEIQIEHIIPYSRSMNDSQFNKTLCFNKENQYKHNRTPWEAYGHDEKHYAEMIERVKQFQPSYRIVKLGHDNAMIKTAYNEKYKLFMKKELDDDFISRQLVDTAYISREVRNFLLHISKNVTATPGRVTSMLRHYWGLNTILGGQLDIKNRNDHRHHAVDAIVIASTDQGFVQRLSKYHGEDIIPDDRGFPEPWENFRLMAEEAVNQILVSHAINNRPRGKLHEETYYGKVGIDQKGGIKKTTFAVRKALESITPKQITQIVDKGIRGAVMERLHELGVDTTGKFKIPKDAFLEPIMAPGNKHPIKRVRVAVPTQNMEKLYADQELYVEYGTNHHMEIFEDADGNHNARVIPLFEAVKRMKNGQPVVNTQSDWDGFTFLMSLAINEMFLLDVTADDLKDRQLSHDALGTQLYRVQKMDVNKNITLRHHTVAITDSADGREIRNVNTIKGNKTELDLLGNVATG